MAFLKHRPTTGELALIGLGLLGFGALAFFACRRSWSGPRSVLVLGDSLVSGQAFMAALAKCLPAGSTIDDYTQTGIGSAALLGDLEGYPDDVQDVIVACGVNDLASNRRVSGQLDAYVISYLEKIYEEARRRGSRVIAVPILPWACYEGATAEATVASRAVNDWIASNPVPDGIAATWLLGDASGCLDKKFAAGDGLHLNATGQRKLAQLLCDAMVV